MIRKPRIVKVDGVWLTMEQTFGFSTSEHDVYRHDSFEAAVGFICGRSMSANGGGQFTTEAGKALWSESDRWSPSYLAS